MSVEHLCLVFMFAGLIVGVTAGFPLGFLMGGLAFIAGYIGMGNLIFYQLVLIVGGGVMRSYALSAIPLFILMGTILFETGLSGDLYEILNQLLRRIRGGLAITTLILAFLISACSGIVGAAVVATGLIALPSMLSRGYSKEITTGIICAGGGIAATIPPSVLMLIYAPVVGISAANLFIASLIPGGMLLCLYLLYVSVRLRFERPTSTSQPDAGEISGRTAAYKAATLLLPTVLIVLGVIGSMFFGIARPLEAAGIGTLGVLLLATLHGRLNLSRLKTSLLYCLRTTSMILFVIVGASLFSGVFVKLGGDKIAQDFILGLTASPSTLMFIMILVIILMGTFVDCVGTILILTPFYLPIIKMFGFDMVWFGVLFCLALGTAHYTPPVSIAVFLLKGVSPEDLPISSMYRGITPFIFLQVIAILIVYSFPQLALFLPGLTRK